MNDWREEALCAKPKNVKVFFQERDIWFHDEDTDPEVVAQDNARAKKMCFECPVRSMCLKEALESQAIHGFRGGLTEEETRQVLSQDETGKEVRRTEFPFCPSCRSDVNKLTAIAIDLPEGGRWSVAKAVRCDSCLFEWKSRSSHNALLAHTREEERREEAEEREAQAIRGLNRPA